MNKILKISKGQVRLEFLIALALVLFFTGIFISFPEDFSLPIEKAILIMENFGKEIDSFFEGIVKSFEESFTTVFEDVVKGGKVISQVGSDLSLTLG